jgi:hypothetical protein
MHPIYLPLLKYIGGTKVELRGSQVAHPRGFLMHLVSGVFLGKLRKLDILSSYQAVLI